MLVFLTAPDLPSEPRRTLDLPGRAFVVLAASKNPASPDGTAGSNEARLPVRVTQTALSRPPPQLQDQCMHINGCNVTLMASDGRATTEIVGITTTAQPDGRIIYSNTSTGFRIEILTDPDGTNHVADFGWPDGKRGYKVTNVVPFVMPV